MNDQPPMPVSALLSVDGVRFRWPCAGEDCIAIDQLDLLPAQTMFVRGPSGCGKSTLLSLAAGVLSPHRGTVRLLGKDWKSMAPAQRDRVRGDHIGYIFQQFNLLPYLSALDNVLLPCRLSAVRAARVGTSPAQQETAQALLQRVGFDATLWRRPASQLSVGQQQRVAAARALIGRPELVIADEPTSALDEPLRDSFMAMLMDACREAGSALLFVSHDPRLAAGFDRQVDLAQINHAAACAAASEGVMA